MDPRRILVADDDVAFLEAVTIRLESAGYEVVRAQDAVQAVSAARRAHPDLVVLDVNMPAGDGFTVLDRIQEIEGLESIPVIYLTGERTTRASYGAAEKGAMAIFYKPLDTARFMQTVAEALGTSTADASPLREQALHDLQAAADNWHTAHS